MPQSYYSFVSHNHNNSSPTKASQWDFLTEMVPAFSWVYTSLILKSAENYSDKCITSKEKVHLFPKQTTWSQGYRNMENMTLISKVQERR